MIGAHDVGVVEYHIPHVVPPLDQVKGTVFNLVADHLSHGRVAQARCIVEREFGVPLSLRMC